MSTSRGRTVAFHALIALVVCGQVGSALELAGARLPRPSLVFVLEGVAVAVAIARAFRQPPEPKRLGAWWATGAGVFLFWAVLYFVIGHVTGPMRARTFHDAVLERVPLRPELAPIYLGVHAFGILPFCALPEVRLLRRHLLGAVLIVGVSAILWVAFPVRLARSPIPSDMPGFGAWLMRGIHTLDPEANCFPSAHCAIAVYAAIGLRFARSRLLFVWGISTAVAICFSTIFTHQHYVADVVSGALLATVAAYVTQRNGAVRAMAGEK